MDQLKPFKSAEQISTAGKLIKDPNYNQMLKSNPLLIDIHRELEIDEDGTNVLVLFYQYVINWLRRGWAQLTDKELMTFFESWLATVEPTLSKNKFLKYWLTVKQSLNAFYRHEILDATHVASLTRAIYDRRQVLTKYHTALNSNLAGYIPEIFLQAPLFPGPQDCSLLAEHTYIDWVCLFTLIMYRPVFWMYWQRRIACLGSPDVTFNPTIFLQYWEVDFLGVIRAVRFAFQQAGYQDRGVLNALALRHSLREDRAWTNNFMDKTGAGNVEGGESLLKECINRISDFFIRTPARLCQECPARCFNKGANLCPFFQQMNPQFFCQKLPEGWEHVLPPIPPRAR